MSLAVSKSGSLNDCSDRLDMTLWNNMEQYHWVFKAIEPSTSESEHQNQSTEKRLSKEVQILIRRDSDNPCNPTPESTSIILQVWH